MDHPNQSRLRFPQVRPDISGLMDSFSCIARKYRDMVGIIAKHVQKTQNISYRKDPEAVVAAVERALPPVVADIGIHLIYFYDGRFYTKMRDWNLGMPKTRPHTNRDQILVHNDITYYCITTAEEMRALPRYAKWDRIGRFGFPMILVPRNI